MLLSFLFIECLSCPVIPLPVLKYRVDKGCIFLANSFKCFGFVSKGDTIDDLRNACPVLFHLLVVAATLVGIASEDHISHEVVDANPFLLVGLLEEFPEVD